MSEEIREVVFIVIAGTLLMLTLIVFIVSFFFVHQRRQLQNLQDKQDMKAAFQQEILQAQLEIQNQTLQHVSGELHDNIGQLLSVARLQLNMLEIETLPTTEKIVEVNEVIAKTIHELRALSKSLDSDFVQDFGLVESLSHELQRIRSAGNYQTEIVVEGQAYRLDGQKEIVLFRVAQEILNNILKHAAAKSIQVFVYYEPTQFGLTIRDNGKGFDYESVLGREMSQTGAGLRNIQRRVALIGGHCRFESQIGQGTSVEIKINIPSFNPIAGEQEML